MPVVQKNDKEKDDSVFLSSAAAEAAGLDVGGQFTNRDPAAANDNESLSAQLPLGSLTNENRQDTKNLYRYSGIPGHRHIRLLRLLPARNEYAPLHSQLFDYPLLELGEGPHLYEALSYVWGSSQKPHILHIDEKSMPITANLYEALLRLRDKMIERILWIDAVCIDQTNIEERGEQIQYMAEIYSKANRVIVWLGETADNSDQAIRNIRMAADEESTKSFLDTEDTDRKAVLAILERPWFRRIWVLQEVAAAQHIVMICGSMRIDGYAFCLGLPSMLSDEDIPSHIRSVTYLMRGSIFRPKYSQNSSGGISLDIRPLGALIDMYHTHEATERHDKIFALLGMSSNDPTASGLLPNYKIPWDELIAQLVRFILGERVLVKSWVHQQAAVLFGKGCVIGIVSSVTTSHDSSRGNKQHISIKQKDNSGPSWTIQVAGKPIEIGDLFCQLLGAEKLMVLRPRDDYFMVVMIEFSPPKNDSLEKAGVEQRLEQLESPSVHDFLQVWDWNSPNEEAKTRDYESWMSSRGPEYTQGEWDYGVTKQARLWNLALIMSDAGSNDVAIVHTLQDMKNTCARDFGQTDRRTTLCMSKLSLMYGRTGHLWEAESEFWRVFWVRKNLHQESEEIIKELDAFGAMCKNNDHVQGAKNFDKTANLLKISERHPAMRDKDFAMMLTEASLREVEITEEMVAAAERKFTSPLEVDHTSLRKRYTQMFMEKLLIRAVRKGFIEATYLLLCQENVRVLEEILIAAVNSEDSSGLWCLVGRERDELPVTEDVVIAAASKSNESVLQYLLARHENKVQLTEKAVIAAAKNQERSVLVYLLESWRHKFQITPKVLVAAAENEQFPALKILLQTKGAEFEITDQVVEAAAGNREKSVLATLLQERGTEIRITPKAVALARRNDNFLEVRRALGEARIRARARKA